MRRVDTARQLRLHDVETIMYICTDNHNVILNVSDRSVVSQCSRKCKLQKKSHWKIDIYINNWSPIIDTYIIPMAIVSPKDTGNVG